MLTWEEYVPSAGTYGIVQHINWHWVKPFLLGVLVVNGLLWAGAVFLTRQLARRKKEQEDVRDIAERLRQALDSDGDASQVFPPQQQETAAQVAEWKSKLQRREQALQQETARKNDLITYPVSYTHLDVYKRQACTWLFRSPLYPGYLLPRINPYQQPS